MFPFDEDLTSKFFSSLFWWHVWILLAFFIPWYQISCPQLFSLFFYEFFREPLHFDLPQANFVKSKCLFLKIFQNLFDLIVNRPQLSDFRNQIWVISHRYWITKFFSNFDTVFELFTPWYRLQLILFFFMNFPANLCFSVSF